MRIRRCVPVLAALGLAMVAMAGPARADNNPNGMSFRAVGWFKGKAEITAGQIKCEIPTVNSAISEGAFAMGLWNTFGVDTIYYPDINSPFANPCGVWIQLQNNMIDQAVTLDHIDLKFRIPNAGRFRQFVATRNKFPVACRELRRDTLYLGERINPVNSTQETSGSGAPNVTFIEMLPFVTPQMIHCLRAQYAAIPTDLFVSFPLVVSATAVGVSDAGDTFTSNTIQYTLNLRHLCGNGRVDDVEQCDPRTPFNSCTGRCVGAPNGVCSNNAKRGCASDAECIGTCQAQGGPSECVCVYPCQGTPPLCGS